MISAASVPPRPLWHDICDAAQIWGGPRATEHQRMPPAEEARLLTDLTISPTEGGGGIRAIRSSPG